MRYAYFLALALFLVACGADRSDVNLNDSAAADPEAAAIPTVNPPLAGLDIPFQTFIVGEAATTIKLDNGGSIVIPERAFVYGDGTPSVGEVKINYREFRTPAEVILSGIPMSALNAEGKPENFQSAGMFEIRARDAAGTELQLADTRQIDVNMYSNVPGAYDTWFLDEAANRWERTGSGNQLTPLPQSVSSTTDAAAPVPPAKRNNSRPAINFPVDYTDFPELADYVDVVWEYAGTPGSKTDPDKNEWIFRTDWTDVKLQPGTQAGTYQLVLRQQGHDRKTFTTPVRAIPSEEDYATAMAAFEEQNRTYQSRRAQQNRSLATAGLRSLPILTLGIHNCDIFNTWEENIALPADFRIKEGDEPTGSKPATIYLVTSNGNMVVRFPQNQWRNFAFDGKAQNRLVALYGDKRAALLSATDFAELKEEARRQAGGEQSFTFNLTPQTEPLASAADLDVLLGLD